MTCKKLALLLSFINALIIPCAQADSWSDNIVWENYIPAVSLSVLVGVYIYALSSPSQDLKNQSQCRYWDRDFADKLTVYYPQADSIMDLFYIHEIQLIANETKTPVLVVSESHVKHNSAYVDLLFEHAKLLAPCIVYIEKDMSKYTALPFYDFNEFVDETAGIFRSSCTELLEQFKKLQKTNELIIVLGAARDHDRQSIYDIVNLGFNIQYEKPSYKERIEFLRLLFAQRPFKNICIESLAKKTISFSYRELVELVQKAGRYAMASPDSSIINCDIDRAFEEITRIHQLSAYITEKSFYNTCVHEMGHAVAAAHFSDDFILYHATSTPCLKVDDPYDNCSLGMASFSDYQNQDNDVNRYKKKIMVFLAGKIAEHLFFGLSNNKILNSENGYRDFVLDPSGGRSDLEKARYLADKIYKINGHDQDKLLKELYGGTLELLRTYKDEIEKGAKILQQYEFITGSQVYSLLKIPAKKDFNFLKKLFFF